MKVILPLAAFRPLMWVPVCSWWQGVWRRAVFPVGQVPALRAQDGGNLPRVEATCWRGGDPGTLKCPSRPAGLRSGVSSTPGAAEGVRSPTYPHQTYLPGWVSQNQSMLAWVARRESLLHLREGRMRKPLLVPSRWVSASSRLPGTPGTFSTRRSSCGRVHQRFIPIFRTIEGEATARWHWEAWG